MPWTHDTVNRSPGRANPLLASPLCCRRHRRLWTSAAAAASHGRRAVLPPAPAAGGRLEYNNVQFSDPTCLKAKYSRAINAYVGTLQSWRGGCQVEYPDDRCELGMCVCVWWWVVMGW